MRFQNSYGKTVSGTSILPPGIEEFVVRFKGRTGEGIVNICGPDIETVRRVFGPENDIEIVSIVPLNKVRDY